MNKILFLDIETFPNIAYVWGKYQQDVIRYTQQSCIATYAAKWQGGKVFAGSLPEFDNYVPGSYDDSKLIDQLWALLDEADIVVAHNGDNFDVRTCKARFVFHGMTPPSPFRTVDTKKVAKSVGRFNSNALNDLGDLLFNDKKIKTDFDLWQGCINGDKKSWNQMVRYNKKDVLLLEKLYLRLLPWIPNHPNQAVSGKPSCPKCGSQNIMYKGYRCTQTRQYRQFVCRHCGGWSRVVRCEPTGKKVTTN